MTEVSWLADKKNKLRRVASRAQHKLSGERPVVVSLTSYPPRIGTIHHTLRSIFGQTRLPDKVVLYLAKSDFPNREADLPQTLTSLLWRDFEIRWVDDDLMPHKKYFWAFRDFSDALVVTIDDDLIYREAMIDELVAAHRAHPDSIVASRTHLIMFNEDGTLKPYDQWIYEAPHFHPGLADIPSMRLLATTGAGTLFDPALIPQAAFDAEVIRRCCLAADDIWLKVVEVSAGVPVVAATTDQLLEYVPDTQEVALCHVNTEAGGNDVILAALLADEKVAGMLGGFFADMVKDDSLDRFL